MASKIDPAAVLAPRDDTASADMRSLAGLYDLPYYQTRVACRNGHRSPRRTATGECVACVAGRFQRWKARHPEQARARTHEHLKALGKPSVAACQNCYE